METSLITGDFVQGIDERVRHCLMPGMIDPERVAEDVATDPAFSEPVDRKTDAEAVENWEDEGGTFSRSGNGVIVNDAVQIRGNEIRKESHCT